MGARAAAAHDYIGSSAAVLLITSSFSSVLRLDRGGHQYVVLNVRYQVALSLMSLTSTTAGRADVAPFPR